MQVSDPEYIYQEVTKRRLWPFLYFKIREETRFPDLSCSDSRLPDFRNRNRYRDVSPYDQTRIRLQRHNVDYINANFVEVPEAERSYILAQGPLPHTASHFWLMIWEQNCRGVVMLNNVIEKGFIKCHQYFPKGEENGDVDEIAYDDVDLKVTFINENKRPNFTVRTLELIDLQSGDSRTILQFHYVAWPDFGVPKSPEAFLDFLLEVRASGTLSNTVGPVVVHCSAGIGRSGTFSLVDSALVLAEKCGNLKSVDVLKLMMKTRRYRMGLIQSHDQFRFMFEAILEGAKSILNFDVRPLSIEEDLPKEDGDDCFNWQDLIPKNVIDEHPAMMRQNAVPSSTGSNHRLDGWDQESRASFEGQLDKTDEETLEKEVVPLNGDDAKTDAAELRRRKRQERIQNTQAMIDKMKQKQREADEREASRKHWKPYYIVGVSLVVVVGVYLCQRFLW